MTKHKHPLTVPPGFKPFPLRIGFADHNGPLYVKVDANKRLALGFHVLDRHLNPGGICHGGWLMAVADMATGLAAALAEGGRKFTPTVSMSSEFLASVKAGQWVEAWGEALRVGGAIGFAECRLYADGVLAFRASATVKFPRQDGPLDLIKLLCES